MLFNKFDNEGLGASLDERHGKYEAVLTRYYNDTLNSAPKERSIQLIQLDDPDEFYNSIMEEIKDQEDEEDSNRSYVRGGFSIKGEGEGKVTLRMAGPVDNWYDGINCRAIMALLDTFDEIKYLDASIASPGGYMQDAVSLYSYMRRLANDGTEVTMSAPGLIASAGSLIYLAGDERIAYDETIAMFHRPLAGFCTMGHAEEIEETVSEIVNVLETMTDQLSSIIEGRTDYTEDGVSALLSGKGTWLSSKKMKPGGVYTKLISEKKNKSKSKSNGKSAKAKNATDTKLQDEFRELVFNHNKMGLASRNFESVFSAARSEAPAQ